MTDTLPLAGLNIVNTRPREQAAQLTAGIQQLGGNCVEFSLLEISALTDDQPLRALVTRLPEFQLAIFISPNAVRYAMEEILKAGSLPPALLIATVGLGSAKILHDFGVKNVISPTEKFDSESLLELPELQNVQGLRVVIFRGDPGRTLLGDTLKIRGADVEYITCYHRTRPQLDVSALLDVKPDALYVSSSEALQTLWEVLDTSSKSLLAGVVLFVSNLRIAAAAQAQGWKNIVIAEAGDKGLLSALVTWAGNKKGKQS